MAAAAAAAFSSSSSIAESLCCLTAAALAAAVALTASPCLAQSNSTATTPTLATVQKAANDLTFLIAAPGNCLFQTTDTVGNPSSNLAALWLRAAFHDAGTFLKADGSGGADGSLVNELNVTENDGIGTSIASRFVAHNISNPTGSTLAISAADLIQLGGVVTVEHCGGPKIPFRSGRIDATGINNYSVLPDPFFSIAQLKALFVDRMGLTSLDMLVLTTGSHSMGGAHKAITPKVTNETFVPFDSTPGVFDNDIFKKVLDNKCVLPIDCLFATDTELLPYIKLYAANQTAFFDQYAVSLQKMMELTTSSLGDVLDVQIPVHTSLVAEGTYPATSTSKASSSTPTGTSTVSTTPKSGAVGGKCPWSRARDVVGQAAAVIGAAAVVGGAGLLI
ncbi:heme peroxidase [Zopfochytrium polystomum]|nr:heme peroxidase [Zopfochytrium polystomum]